MKRINLKTRHDASRHSVSPLLRVITSLQEQVEWTLRVASLLKDTVNRIGDLLDGWVAEQELQGLSGTTNAGDCTGGR